ncbi:MAG: hypothetical protein ACM3ME_02195 [Chloroflexota bacterium]
MESENYNNRKRTIYLPIAFAIVMVAGFLLGAALVRVSSINKNIGLIQNLQSNKYDPVNDVLGYIMQDYVDSVDPSKLKQ